MCIEWHQSLESRPRTIREIGDFKGPGGEGKFRPAQRVRRREVHRVVSSCLRESLQGKVLSFQDKVETIYRNIFPRAGRNAADEPAPESAARDGIASERYEPDGQGVTRASLFREAPLSLFEEGVEAPTDTSGALYWQLHQSFILIQIRGGMVVIDQHAAHERILYDKARETLEGGVIAAQTLLFPATLELTPEEYDSFEALRDVLPLVGFEVEPFGPRSVIIRGVPSGARNWDDGRLLQEILGETAGAGKGSERFLKSFACRAAVKAGTKLSAEEMESLTDQLFATEFAFTCPHGRPTMLRVSLGELERRFQRSVSPEKA